MRVITIIPLIAVLAIFMISCAVFSIPINSANDTDLTTFLKADTTSDHAYIVGQYQCVQFARDLTHNATIAGFHLNYAIITPNTAYPDGHVIVAIVNTTNQWMFIEPQNDRDITRDLLNNGVNDTITVVDPTKTTIASLDIIQYYSTAIKQVVHI